MTKGKSAPSPSLVERPFTLHLTGLRPLLMHNGRLANPLDPWARLVAEVSKKRNKTVQDYAELARREARGAMYETADGVLGIPLTNVWKCLQQAGKSFKLGTAIDLAIADNPDILPLFIGGEPQKCDTYLEHHPECLFYRSVVVQRRRTMRARPLMPMGWTVDATFSLREDLLDLARLRPVIERMGTLGLCDWRPKYGTFRAELVE